MLGISNASTTFERCKYLLPLLESGLSRTKLNDRCSKLQKEKKEDSQECKKEGRNEGRREGKKEVRKERCKERRKENK